MVEVNITYQNDLHCQATHQPSQTTLLTDAPVDNHGKGESFSPTDLVAVALGSCILTTMGIVAQMMKINMGAARASVKKEMAARPDRRIGTLTVVIDVPVILDEEQKQRLIKAAMNCPVHHSLHPDIHMPVEFNWA